MSPNLETQSSALDFALTVHPVPHPGPADEPNDSHVAASPHQQQDVPFHRRLWKRWRVLYSTNSFLILVLCAIVLAYVYPPLGAVYLAPQITATWMAVIFIFVLAGMAIKTKELSKAFTRLYFNVFVNVFNFGIVSAIVYGISRFMLHVNALPRSLADGMTIGAALPVAPNMVQVLTHSAGGDEAAAVFNAAFGNLVGVFLSPALIFVYLGATARVDFGDVFFQLGLRVVLPIVVGQGLRNFFPPAKTFVTRHRRWFQSLQEWCLVFIVYTVFCKTFLEGSDATAANVFVMMALQFVLLCFVMVLAWCSLGVLFREEPKLRAMGLFGCTQKTVAMGVPLINAMYESDPLVGLYTLPLLIWHPMQLVLGSGVAPRVAEYVKRNEDIPEGNQRNGDGEASNTMNQDEEALNQIHEDDNEVETMKPNPETSIGDNSEMDGTNAPNGNR